MSGLRGSARLRQRGTEFDVSLEDGEVLAVLGPNGAGKSTLLQIIAGLLRPDAGRVELGGTVLTDTDTGTFVPVHARGVATLSQQAMLFPHMTAEPRLLLLDEPMAALDVTAAPAMRRLLREILRDAGRTAIIVTHDLLDALAVADKVIVVESGPVRDVLTAQCVRGDHRRNQSGLRRHRRTGHPSDTFGHSPLRAIRPQGRHSRDHPVPARRGGRPSDCPARQPAQCHCGDDHRTRPARHRGKGQGNRSTRPSGGAGGRYHRRRGRRPRSGARSDRVLRDQNPEVQLHPALSA